MRQLSRVTRGRVLGRDLMLVFAMVALWPVGEAQAAPADGTAADIIVDDIGSGWTRATPDPPGSTPSSADRQFSSADAVLQLEAQPRLDCTTGVTGRSNELGFIRSLAFVEQPDDGSGVVTFTGDTGGASAAAAVFSTARFAFLVVVFANDAKVALRPIVDSVVALQAARDGGVVIESPPARTRLDAVLVSKPPIDDLGDQFDYDANSFSCGQLGSGAAADGGGPARLDEVSKIASFLSTHSRERIRAWFNLSTKTSAVVDLTDYPYELFAGTVLGSSLSSKFEPVPAETVDGIDQIPNVAVWRIDGEQPQYFASFRRGRIVALIAVSEGPKPGQALVTLSALARAQFDALPSGATTVLRVPSPAKSVATSGSLIALIGVGVLGVRRARAGRIKRTVVRRDEAHSFDVSSGADRLRRRGLALGGIQVGCVVGIVVFLASDIGWLRVIGAGAILLLGIGATMRWRRQEARLLGAASAQRVHPRPSIGSAALTLAALVLLAGGGGLIVWGLRETLFVPSLTHLRISDSVSIEPRLLAWLTAAVGLIVIIVDSFLLRAARALARVGWREWTEAAPPIVYLRSFEDDDVQLANVLSARRPFLEFFTLRGHDAFEESVAWELSHYGPVLAIARPGRSDHSLGAARVHLRDDEWQAAISEQIAEAKAVVITIGRTPGLGWELNHIVQTGCLDKTLLLVPPLDAAEIQLRWDFIAEALAAAGGGQHPLSADPACLVVVKVQPANGPTTAFCADRRDEATYRAAVTAVLA